MAHRASGPAARRGTRLKSDEERTYANSQRLFALNALPETSRSPERRSSRCLIQALNWIGRALVFGDW